MPLLREKSASKMPAVTTSFGHCQEYVITCALKLLKRIELVIIDWIILCIKEEGRHFNAVKSSHCLSLFVVICQGCVAEHTGNYGTLVHVHHTEAILIELRSQGLELLSG